jgi:hypothetical protein
VTGFFRVVSRYARPARVEQQENRLTQVFAGTLKYSPGLALALALHWLAPDLGDSAEERAAQSPDAGAALAEGGLVLRGIQPQRPTYGGKTVDLELRFGHPNTSGAEDIVIWVEVKHGASPHEHQLRNYLDDIQKLGVRASAVVLLAPRQSYPFTTPERPPPEVRQRHWQRTAGHCARWARKAEGVPRFLVTEFLDYLEEEKFMDLEVITPVHLVALAEYQRTLKAIETVLQVASGYVACEWAERFPYEKGTRKPKLGIGYWEAHPQAKPGQTAADWDPGWWDWNLREDDLGIEDSRGGVPAFAVGLTSEEPIVTPQTAVWAKKLIDSDDFTEFEDNYYRFDRIAYPEEVLIGRTLEQQGKSLGRWVVEGYRALYAAGPPRDF